MGNISKQQFYEIIPCGANISYVLTSDSFYSSTEFKILQSQKIVNFANCCKMRWNGRIQLLYFTSNCIPFADYIQSSTPESTIAIIEQIISTIISVKNNGFLSYYNIEISFNRIFIDQTNNQVHMIYLPINHKLFTDAFQFNTTLYGELFRSTRFCPILNEVLKCFSDRESISVEELFSKVSNISSELAKSQGRIIQKNKKMKLIAVNSPFPLEIAIDKDNFIIGRNESVVDGFVPFSKMIGRQHCKICYKNNEYFVVDLNSQNGTYLNQRKNRLPANQLCSLSNGDILRLAKFSFRVEIL